LTPRLKTLLRRVGLLGTARRARELVRAAAARGPNAVYRRQGAPDGLPIPPTRLIIRVTGTPDVGWFLEGGARAAESIRSALARQGTDVGRLGALLDFGCGCGRVARHWAGLAVQTHGCDLDPALVGWCRRRLPHGRFVANDVRPPLPYPGATFDLVYALSVFTHLPEALQRPWMEELRRVLRPGGHLILSVHGESYRKELTPDERRRFDAGQLVVREEGPAGSNAYGAYHPRPYLGGPLTGGFDLAELRPQGALGNPHQDLLVLRKRPI
jgi:SAM-dependent methyltransferase